MRWCRFGSDSFTQDSAIGLLKEEEEEEGEGEGEGEGEEEEEE